VLTTFSTLAFAQKEQKFHLSAPQQLRSTNRLAPEFDDALPRFRTSRSDVSHGTAEVFEYDSEVVGS
jgi:hypothetical protein